MNIFLNICPICGFPHDDGVLITTKNNSGEEKYISICLDCIDLHSEDEIKKRLSNRENVPPGSTLGTK